MKRAQLFARKQYLTGKSVIVEKRQLDVSYAPHFHDFFEIEYIVKGEGKHILNGEELEINTGDIYFLTPEDIHSIYPSGDLELYNIMFTEDFLSPKAVLPAIEGCHGKRFNLTKNSQDKILPLLVQFCEEFSESNEGGTQYMQGLLSCILVLLLRNAGKNLTLPAPTPIATALVFIQSNFKENITLNDAAAQANLSPGYFCELFKKYMGTGFNTYLNELRLSYAAKALKTTAESISQIAFLSGFSSFSTFSRLFKQKYSVSPKDYRKKDRE